MRNLTTVLHPGQCAAVMTQGGNSVAGTYRWRWLTLMKLNGGAEGDRTPDFSTRVHLSVLTSQRRQKKN